LPLMARAYILETRNTKEIVSGVSPEFAMTKMDDEHHPECELFVEDVRGATLLGEILSRHASDLFVRCSIIPYGTANLGVALGQLTKANRFPRPTVIFRDGDQDSAPGCILLPGEDAPERVVFEGLRSQKWRHLWTRIGRDVSSVADACERAMTLTNHHDWVRFAANQLMCGGDALWQSMCSEWAEMTPSSTVTQTAEAIQDAINNHAKA
ncbi:MAG: hypothetical protein J0H89_07050, partial [Rhizobiales bacterium]|nr:hypothetical protein [Hyphomicrobiales bacterium]